MAETDGHHDHRELSTGHWCRLRDLFADVREMPASERVAFLDRVLAGEPALRAEIDSLLECEQAADSFLVSREPGRAPRGATMLTQGTRLGTYEILAPLGAGGMGEVYRARDLRLGREIALKVLPESLTHTAIHLDRFEGEARILAGLNHPNIVTLFSVEDEDDIRFLTMELIEGQSLYELIPPGGLPLPRVLDLAIAIADALMAAHDKGVVHRDLKPANVMVTRDGRVKVLDFGLAKLAPGVGPADIGALMNDTPSETGRVAGTVPYMAPEQIRAEPLDGRTDLFAFGILLYELIAGRRPFAGSTAMSVSAAILKEAPEPLVRLRADLPGDIAGIVHRCLEKSPRERFQTAHEVSKELRRLGRGLERDEPAAVPEATRLPEPIASIAVLPFVNRSASVEDEYFSDGLADELLAVLGKVEGLRVAARASAFYFKGKNTTIAEIGRALNVATVLEGSVRKAANRVRISVQLVNVAGGFHIWSETYDRTFDDLLAVQDDIAQAVVKQLRRTLLSRNRDSDPTGAAKADVARAARGRSTDPEAHRLYLLARHMNDRFLREETAKAIEYLNEALARDAEFALAWVELSRAYANGAHHCWTPAEEGYQRSREAVDRALALEPDLAEGLSSLGWIQMMYDRDWAGAQISFARALQLDPGNALVLRRAGTLAISLNRVEESIALCRRAVEQDPLNPGSYSNLTQALHVGDRQVEAEQVCQRWVDIAPQQATTKAILSMIMLSQGRQEDALAAAAHEPDEGYRLWALGIIHHAAGRQQESNEALRQLVAKHGEGYAYQIAEFYAVRGEVDEAFEWLERAYAHRDGGLNQVPSSRRLCALHSDRRWAAFMKKMGFDPIH